MGDALQYVNRCHYGDARVVLREMVRDGVKVQATVTSPPYFGLRSYLANDDPDKHLEIGTESLDDYIANLVDVFRQVKALLNDDGTLWIVIGDSRSGSGGSGGDYGPGGKREGQPKFRQQRIPGLAAKNLVGVPWRLALALQDDGWVWRQCLIWDKIHCLPESVKDRPTTTHEYILMFARSPQYFYNQDSIRELHNEESIKRCQRKMNPTGNRDSTSNPQTLDSSKFCHPLGKNRGSVWRVNAASYPDAHYAVFPLALIEPIILASSRPGDTILDPFFGSGTTGEAAERLGRRWIGCELNSQYKSLIDNRTAQMGLFT